MALTLIIPKRHVTFARCIEAVIKKHDRKMYQSDLKRLVCSRSWRTVVKREIDFWNRLIQYEYPGSCLITFKRIKNPKTGRKNEVLYQIPQENDVRNRPSHLLLTIQRGERNG